MIQHNWSIQLALTSSRKHTLSLKDDLLAMTPFDGWNPSDEDIGLVLQAPQAGLEFSM